MRGRFTVNGLSAVRALVLDGAGLHVGPRWAFADDLAAGRLTALLPEWRLEAFPLPRGLPSGRLGPGQDPRLRRRHGGSVGRGGRGR